VTLAPVYFPGTTEASQAATIILGEAEERGGVDFQAKVTPISRISGTVILPPGVSPASVELGLRPVATAVRISTSSGTRPRADGSFSFGGIVPGSYAVVAAVVPRAQTAGPSAALWALCELEVTAGDVTNVALSLQPALTVSGRVVFEGQTPPPANLAKVLVGLHPMRGILQPRATTVNADASGRFTMSGVLPGRYKLAGGGRDGGPGPNGWYIKSATVEGRDTMDFPIDLRRIVDDAVVTFTDRTTEVAGVVRDADGKPIGGLTVIVAAADRTFWNPNSRHIHTAQPGTDGRFTIRGSPPGDYWIGAVADVEEDEWYDSAFLERFTRRAQRISLADGERRRHDLSVAVR
jgi:Carboxypeptidase regulatory-like domain